MPPMNPLAQDLNNAIAGVNPYVLEMLSQLGRELYFPKGILTQAAEAKQHAHRYNATIGTAMEEGVAMSLPIVMQYIQGISPNDALLYAPSPGLPALREEWVRKLLVDNPDLQGRGMSLPVVTSGLTHGLSLVADLFMDPGDVLLLPDQIWGNYRLIFGVRRQAVIRQYPFFKGNGLDLGAFRKALAAACAERNKAVVLLNFPNNPTGYTPTEAEGQALAEALTTAAQGGTNVVALTDDAYYGLFFDDQAMKQSLFARLAGLHPRLLAIKGDAATKEAYVWGLRVGFLTFAAAGAPTGSPLYEALEKKTAGCIRGLISNSPQLSQKIVLNALRNPAFFEQRGAKASLMRARAMRVKEVLADPKYAEAWTPYPFNSGYFMCVRVNRVGAEPLRVHLLKQYGVGTISTAETDLRIAFSSLEVNQIQDFFDLVLQAWRDLAAAAPTSP
jgi:aspartate/methionine/tyrosine aminotransferase